MIETKEHLNKYPKLIGQEIDMALRSQDPSTAEKLKRSKNKEFLYTIAIATSAFFITAIYLIGSLSPEMVQQLSRFLEAIPFLDLKLSKTLISELKFPNPVTNTMLGGTIVFSSFVFFDLFRKDEISYDGSKDLFKESSSVSYLIHLLALLCIILSILISWHPKPKVQVTQIEYIQTQVPSKKKPKNTKRRAAKQSIDSGKHDPKRKVTPVTKPTGRPRLPSPKPKPKVSQAKPIPKPKQTAKPRPKKPARPSPRPKALPRPKAIREAINPVQEKLPKTKTLPKLMNYGNTTGAKSNSSSSPVPAPKASQTASGTGARGSELVSRLSNIPRAPDSLGGGQGGAYGAPGNPPPNSYPNRPPSIAAQADVNFGPYMSALQRKIKRSWKPPRGTESNRIVVTFTVLANGSLADLKVITKSTYPEANIAAMEAVTRASPFDPLPPGSGDSVDIEFTFDYNVFQKTRW